MKTLSEGDRIDRKLIGYLLGIALLCGVLGGALTGHVLRTETRVEHVQKVTEVTRVAKKVQRIESVEYKTVKEIAATPLANPMDACHGAPVRIIEMTSDTVGEGANKSTRTWITAQPVGDAYTVVCRNEGYLLDLWKKGMVVRLLNGKADGEN